MRRSRGGSDELGRDPVGVQRCKARRYAAAAATVDDDDDDDDAAVYNNDGTLSSFWHQKPALETGACRNWPMCHQLKHAAMIDVARLCGRRPLIDHATLTTTTSNHDDHYDRLSSWQRDAARHEAAELN